MFGAPYVPPPVKNRLSKPQVNHNVANFSTPARFSRSLSQLSCSLLDNCSTEQLPNRTSCLPLKNPTEARRELQAQVDTLFPDSRGEVSAEIGRGKSLDYRSSSEPMGMYDRFKSSPAPAFAQNEGALSSSSTVDSVGQVARMIGQENKIIDVEAAINLLQELKKNASPEELVALHRALLPTKDVETVSSPVSEGFGDRSSFNPSSTRRSSRLPPGLATRGGTDEDPLRRQADLPLRQKRGSMQFEHTPSPVQRKFSGSTERKFSTSTERKFSSSTERKLSGSTARPSPLPTPDETPDEIPPNELSRTQTPNEERYGHMGAYKHGSLRITNGAASPEPGRLMRPHLEHSESEPILSEPQRKTSLDFHPGRPSIDRAATQATRQRVLHSARGPTLSPAWSRRNSTVSPKTQDFTSQLLSQPYTPLQLSTNNLQKSPDQDTEPMSAPPSVPQHAQRFSRRESTMSLPSPSESDQAPTPRAAPTLMDFASRLSTVFGEDAEPDSRSGTPEDALSKLTGEADKRPEMRRRSTSAKPRYYPTILPDEEQPTKVKHMDSGYGSDDRRLSNAMPSPKEIRPETSPHPMVRDSFFHVAKQSATDDNSDGKSMYTCNEFLTSPATSQPPSPSLPQLNSKKSRFLALRSKSFTNKRNSAPVSPTYAPQQLNDSMQTIDSTVSQATGTDRSSRQIRKLQKPHPKDLKKSRSLRKAVLKEVTTADNLPAVSKQVNDTHAKRLQNEPNSSHVNQTYQQADSAESQDDLTPLPTNKPVTDPIISAVEAQHKPSIDQKRSFSRGRKGFNSANSSAEDLSDNKKSSMFRKRSKSRGRSTKPIDEKDEELTTDDFSPMASSLGAGPYDQSTNQFKRKPSTGKPGVQSPWQISTGLLKSKAGMNEEMASELARKKSRDVAMRDTEPHEERVRMATPNKKGKKERAAVKPPVPQTSNRSVEDFYPDWTSKAAGTPPQQTVPARAFSMYAESVPPLPDLPMDVLAKAAKAEEMMAKKLKASPTGSARQSLEPTPSPKPSKAKTSVEARREQDQQLEEEKKANEESLHLLHPTVRPKSTDADVSVAVRELGSGSDTESKDSRPTSSDGKHEDPIVEPSSPSHDATHPGWPGWEQQAKLWRDRRLAATLPHSTLEEEEPSHDPTPVQSPSIVVSRYITPMGADTAARANALNQSPDPTSAASQHADLYRDLIDNKENRPAKSDLPRTDSATSANTFVTVQTHQSDNYRATRHELPRADSAFAGKNWTSTTSTTTSMSTTRYPRGRPAPSPRQPSRSRSRDAYMNEERHYAPYNPYRADGTGRARDPSLGRTATSSSYYNPQSNTTTTTTRIQIPRPPLQTNPTGSNTNSTPVVDRYSGGLQYEWDRQGGFGGSAGTRLSGSGESGGAPRKGMAMAEQWGVDLGDVPVFLQRRGVEGGMI